MAVYSHQLAGGVTGWFSILDLPTPVDGHRRQRKKRGLASERAAAKADREARAAFSQVALTADGSVA